MRDKRRTKNRPLNAFVERGVLTIEIGVDVLAFACLHEGNAGRYDKNTGRWRYRNDDYVITDNVGFAKEVVRALTAEAEDGSSMLTALFDKAIENAIDDGAEHFEPKEAETDK